MSHSLEGTKKASVPNMWEVSLDMLRIYITRDRPEEPRDPMASWKPSSFATMLSEFPPLATTARDVAMDSLNEMRTIID